MRALKQVFTRSGTTNNCNNCYVKPERAPKGKGENFLDEIISTTLEDAQICFDTWLIRHGCWLNKDTPGTLKSHNLKGFHIKRVKHDGSLKRFNYGKCIHTLILNSPGEPLPKFKARFPLIDDNACNCEAFIILRIHGGEFFFPTLKRSIINLRKTSLNWLVFLSTMLWG